MKTGRSGSIAHVGFGLSLGLRWLLFAVLLAAMSGRGAAAAELIMFERQGCPWCATWDREIGSIYDKTAEARRLPLRRVDIEHAAAVDSPGAAAVRFTPTFVVTACNREIARIVGYVGDWQFWGLLDEAIAKLPPERGADRC